MYSRKLLRAQIQTERFLRKASRRNEPLETFRKKEEYVKFEHAVEIAIRKQIIFVSTHLNEIKIWENDDLAEHQIEAIVATYLDRHMPTSGDLIAQETVYNAFYAAFNWSCKAAYERLGVKILRKAAEDYTVDFELTNQAYIDALENDANYLLTIKSKGYDQTTKDRLINIVKQGRLAKDTIDDVASDLNAQVDGISSVRAFMIANTETANAFGTANQAFMSENDVPQKEWVIAGPHNLEDECDDNADASPIPVDEDFPSGDATEPAHTNCECYVNGVGLDLSTMSDEELDSQILWDGGDSSYTENMAGRRSNLQKSADLDLVRAVSAAIAEAVGDLKNKIIENYPPVQPLDINALSDSLANKVKESVVVEHKTIDNTTVQQTPLPKELIDILRMQGEAITLLKNQPKPRSLEDYRPHDQDKNKLAGISYFGFADMAGNWYILCQQGKMQRYAAGQSDYIAAWKSRGDHQYTTLAGAMNG